MATKKQIAELRNALRMLIQRIPNAAVICKAHSFNELVAEEDMEKEMLIKETTGVTRAQLIQLFQYKDTTMIDYMIEECWAK